MVLGLKLKNNKKCHICGFDVTKDKEYTVRNGEYYCQVCSEVMQENKEAKKRFVATTSMGFYFYDTLTDKRYDAVDNCYDIMDLLNELNDEITVLKKKNNELQNRISEQEDVKWLRENTVWENMPTSRRTYTKTTSLHPKKYK